MAKANWAVVNPSSGSGNKTINVSSTTKQLLMKLQEEKRQELFGTRSIPIWLVRM